MNKILKNRELLCRSYRCSLVELLQQLLQQALLATGQTDTTNAKLLACLSQPGTTTPSLQQTAGASAVIPNTRQDVVSSTTEATAVAVGSNKVVPLVPNSVNVPVALAAVSMSSTGTISNLTHITPNINQLLPSTLHSVQ